MKAEIRDERTLVVTRDEKDKPVVPRGIQKAKNAAEFNSWRVNYVLRCDTKSEAENALKTVLQINDFDKAAAWLDKQ
jgi:hypothetical protein